MLADKGYLLAKYQADYGSSGIVMQIINLK